MTRDSATGVWTHVGRHSLTTHGRGAAAIHDAGVRAVFAFPLPIDAHQGLHLRRGPSPT
jgi:hypothetical protein